MTSDVRRDTTHPTLHEWLHTKRLRLHVDHATSTYRCGARHEKILHLSQRSMLRSCHDNQRVSITSNIIVIYGVSVRICPEFKQSFLLSSKTVFIDSIHIASTGPSNMTLCLEYSQRNLHHHHHLLPVMFNGLVSTAFSDSISENTVCPLMALFIELTVELSHRDALRVEHMHVDLRET